jgi:hypothetical protein
MVEAAGVELDTVQKQAHFLILLDKPTLSNRQNRSKSLLDPQITPRQTRDRKVTSDARPASPNDQAADAT